MDRNIERKSVHVQTWTLPGGHTDSIRGAVDEVTGVQRSMRHSRESFPLARLDTPRATMGNRDGLMRESFQGV